MGKNHEVYPVEITYRVLKHLLVSLQITDYLINDILN